VNVCSTGTGSPGGWIGVFFDQFELVEATLWTAWAWAKDHRTVSPGLMVTVGGTHLEPGLSSRAWIVTVSAAEAAPANPMTATSAQISAPSQDPRRPTVSLPDSMPTSLPHGDVAGRLTLAADWRNYPPPEGLSTGLS
jgi:hypothetical protein